MKSGTELKEAGIKRSSDNAGTNWNNQADITLCEFIKLTKKFQTEDFRAFAVKEGLPNPPHLRAFGSVVVRAVKRGLIKSVGTEKVTNPRAHNAFATVWAVV